MTIREKLASLLPEPRAIGSAAGAAFLLSLTLLFLGPSYLYFRNILQVQYYYTDMVWFFAAYALAAGGVLTVALLLLRGNLRQRAVALVFALGLLFWIQGNILVWNYGVLDGRRIVWSDFLLNGIIDSAVWIAVIAVALIKAPLVHRYAGWAGAFLIVIQGAGLGAEIVRAPEEPAWKSYSIGYDDEQMFEFSGKRNVIVLILDMFQPDIFQEIIEEDRAYRDLFDGFTFYRNAIGGFPTTYPSVVYILTGRYYDNSVPIQDFIRTEMSTRSIPLALKEAGYQVDLYPLVSPRAIYHSEEISSNAGRQAERGGVERVADGRRAAGEMLQLALFRQVPHIFKRRFYFVPYIETRHRARVDQDVVFYNSLVANTTISDENNIFKFYHLKGAHTPFRLNSRLQTVDLPQDRRGGKEQARAALIIAGELLRQLRVNNVYDDSLIFIVADHGNPWAGVGLRPQLLGKTSRGVSEELVNLNVITSALTLMLVKPFHASGDLEISDAPVTLGDIPRTIASLLNLPGKFPGRSILEVGEDEDRERVFYHYVWDGGWDHSYLPEMEKYTVRGHSWLPGSWRPAGKILAP